MDAMLLLMFFAGVIIAIIVPTTLLFKRKPRTCSSYSSEDSQLDTVDEMVLYGEVTGDEFYGIM